MRLCRTASGSRPRNFDVGTPRVESSDEKARIESACAALTPHLEEAEITVQGAVGRPPMPESASTELFAMALDLPPGLEGKAVGGGSDGNFTAALGVPTLDGLGAVGGGAHADHEYLVIESMEEGRTSWPGW